MNLLKPLLPFLSIVTFVAGYLLSNLDRLWESRRKLHNMKMILFKEMSENYKLLNKVIPLDKSDRADPSLIAIMAHRFSFAVYDRYLDRLDQMRTDDLGKIYEACFMLRGLQSDANTFLTASRVTDATPQTREYLAAQATLLVSMISKCHELLTQALIALPDGSVFLREQEGDRGSALVSLKEISSLLIQDRLTKMDR